MFVGHYGPAGAAAGRHIKLWHCFIAVQFLDILWAPFVLLGIEKLRIVPHFTAANHFDLYHMPFTHSLPMAVVWSVAAGAGYRLLRRGAGWTGALLIAALVFSHWILDFVTHKPDLELWIGGPKIGLSLWDYRGASFGLEIGLFIVGMAIYLARSRASGLWGRVLPAILIALGLLAQVFANWGPPPPDPAAAAWTAIIAYLLFALLAAAVDGARSFDPLPASSKSNVGQAA